MKSNMSKRGLVKFGRLGLTWLTWAWLELDLAKSGPSQAQVKHPRVLTWAWLGLTWAWLELDLGLLGDLASHVTWRFTVNSEFQSQPFVSLFVQCVDLVPAYSFPTYFVVVCSMCGFRPTWSGDISALGQNTCKKISGDLAFHATWRLKRIGTRRT